MVNSKGTGSYMALLHSTFALYRTCLIHTRISPPLHSKPFVPNIHTLNRANRVQCLTQDISVKELILTFNLEQPGIEQSTFQ